MRNSHSLASAVAGWFGPDNYHDCVLENLKGKESSAAVLAVRASCRGKFPLTPAEIAEQKRKEAEYAKATEAAKIQQEQESEKQWRDMLRRAGMLER